MSGPNEPYCHRCLRWFVDPQALKQHEEASSFHASLVHICATCGEGFHEIEELEEHQSWRSHHPHPFTCPPPCSRTFTNANNLFQHSKVHLPKKLECTHCYTHFSLVGSLFLHLEAGTCSSGFKRSDLIQVARTMDRKHLFTLPNAASGYRKDSDDEDSDMEDRYCYPGRDTWQCYECDRYFPTEKAVLSHLRSPVHKTKVFVCNGCDTEFANISGLAQHLESKSCSWGKGLRVLKRLVYGLRSNKRFTLK